MTAHDAESLWDWALRIYAAPGVADALLTVQDQAGGDVLILLWAIRASEQGAAVTPALANAAVAACAPDAVAIAALRARRRAASPANQTPRAEELALEKTVLARLSTIKPAPMRATLEHNLAAALQATGANLSGDRTKQALARLVEALGLVFTPP